MRVILFFLISISATAQTYVSGKIINDTLFVPCGCRIVPLGTEGDFDNDGVAIQTDNCPIVANANQADLDGDGRGDVCDDDRDGDGLINDLDCDPDNDLVVYGPSSPCDDNDVCTINDQTDANCDCVGQPATDTDSDSICDLIDNCVNDANVNQDDFDSDGLGDVCDDDDDNDGAIDAEDCLPFNSSFAFVPDNITATHYNSSNVCSGAPRLITDIAGSPSLPMHKIEIWNDGVRRGFFENPNQTQVDWSMATWNLNGPTEIIEVRYYVTSSCVVIKQFTFNC